MDDGCDDDISKATLSRTVLVNDLHRGVRGANKK